MDNLYQVDAARYISPADVRPSANVRGVRDSGVRALYRNLQEQGWSTEKGLRVKELPIGSDGKQYYGCIDGMHRLRALEMLRKEEEEALKKIKDEAAKEKMKYWGPLKVLASVYHRDIPRRTEIRLAVEANRSTGITVFMTLFDMLSAMREVRKLLLEESKKKRDGGAVNVGVTTRSGTKSTPTSKTKRSKDPNKWNDPSDIPQDLVTNAYRGVLGEGASYKQNTMTTFSSLLYRFDNCPHAWEELKHICNNVNTEKALTSYNLYHKEFSEKLPDAMKLWVLRRFRAEYLETNVTLSRGESKELIGLQVCLLYEVEKLASIFGTDLIEFKWGSNELEKLLRKALQEGTYDKYIPGTEKDRKRLNQNASALLAPFDNLVASYHESGHEALEQFWRENRRGTPESNASPDKRKTAEPEAREEDEEEQEQEKREKEREKDREQDMEEEGEKEVQKGAESDGAVEHVEDVDHVEHVQPPLKRSISSQDDSQDHRAKKQKIVQSVSAPVPSFKAKDVDMYGQSFEEFLKGEHFLKIKGKAQLILTDPPYNINKGVDHDRITDSQMRLFAQGASDILRSGGVLVAFCSWQQLAKWKQYLEEAQFLVSRVPLHIIMPRNYHRRSNFPQNIVDYCIYAIAKVKTPSDQRVYLRWNDIKYVQAKRPFPAYTNCLVHEIPKNNSRLMKDKKNEIPWRTEEKPLPLIKELMARFSSTDEIVVDLFAGTFPTALAAIDLSRTFVGCEVDVPLFKAAASRVKAHIGLQKKKKSVKAVVGKKRKKKK